MKYKALIFVLIFTLLSSFALGATLSAFNVPTAYQNQTIWSTDVNGTVFSYNYPVVTFNTSVNTNCALDTVNSNYTTMVANEATSQCSKSSNYCYQESANVSNQTGIDGNCGLNYTGKYLLSNTTQYIYINYSKPTNSKSTSLWRVHENSRDQNYTIPIGCFNQPVIQLSLFSASCLDPKVQGQCYNGSSWVNIFTYNGDGDCVYDSNEGQYPLAVIDGNWNVGSYCRSGNAGFTTGWESAFDGFSIASTLYEEAMVWNIGETFQNCTLNSVNLLALGNNSLYIACNDSQTSTATLGPLNLRMIPFINTASVSPLYPRSDEQLNLSFNITSDALSAPLTRILPNVSITWFSSPDSGTYTNNNSYNYLATLTSNGQLFTTGSGTGSVTGIKNNYTNWKAQITLLNGADILNTYNTSAVNVYPLTNLTINSPISGYASNNATLPVNFSVIDKNGGLICNLTTDGTTHVMTVTSNTTTLHNHTYSSEGIYNWNLTCSGNGNYAPLFSGNYQFTYATVGPIASNFANTQTAFAPQIGETIYLSATISDSYLNIDTCKLQINDSGSWRNYSTHSINTLGTYLLNTSFIVTTNSTITNNNVSWRFVCNDTINNIATSATQNFTVKDYTNPTITINSGISNNSVISNLRHNLTYNITFTDNNLFQQSVNVTCDTSGEIYYWENLSSTGTTVTRNATVNLTGLPLQKCYMYIQASDGHTAQQIPNYDITTLDNGLDITTEHNIDIRITSDDTDINSIDTQNALSFQIKKSPGYSLDTFVDEVKAVVTAYAKTTPNLQFVETLSQKESIQRTYGLFIENFWETALLVFCIILLFL